MVGCALTLYSHIGHWALDWFSIDLAFYNFCLFFQRALKNCTGVLRFVATGWPLWPGEHLVNFRVYVFLMSFILAQNRFWNRIKSWKFLLNRQIMLSFHKINSCLEHDLIFVKRASAGVQRWDLGWALRWFHNAMPISPRGTSSLSDVILNLTWWIKVICRAKHAMELLNSHGIYRFFIDLVLARLIGSKLFLLFQIDSICQGDKFAINFSSDFVFFQFF